MIQLPLPEERFEEEDVQLLFRYLILLLIATLTDVSAGLAQETKGSSPPSRPNILWFVVEDMSAHFSCYGEQVISTPHVDRLANRGIKFTHAFTSAPVCSTSRSALISGMYQTAIGAHHHRSGRGELKLNLPPGVEPIPALLQRAGYYTCIGSGLRAAEDKQPPGRSLGKTDYNFEWDQSIYDSNDWASREPNQPFFMQVQLSGGKLRGESAEERQLFLERVKKELGTLTSAEKVTLPPYYPRDPELLEDWAAYLDAVRMTDHQVGQVLARLEHEGLLDQTLIIFLTDHGISHARGKQFLYDEGTHVPLIVCGAGIEAASIRNDLVVHFDVAATTLAAAGLKLPSGMQAKDLLASDYQIRSTIFAARDRCDETVDRIRSVRTERWLYIRNGLPQRPMLQPNAYKDRKSILVRLRQLHGSGELDELADRLLFRPSRPAEELYEWKSDRWQMADLSGDQQFQPTLENLRQELDEWMKANDRQGAESEAMYDSDMRAYVGRGNPDVEANIALMKRWASEGK